MICASASTAATGRISFAPSQEIAVNIIGLNIEGTGWLEICAAIFILGAWIFWAIIKMRIRRHIGFDFRQLRAGQDDPFFLKISLDIPTVQQ